MNVKNNRRRQATIDKIETVFVELLQTKDLSQITVSDICKVAEINRSTFYANFTDIYDLADKIRDKLEADLKAIYGIKYSDTPTANDTLKILIHIYENQLFYKTYFKLGYDITQQIDLHELMEASHSFDNRYIEYHLIFYKAGFNAMVKKWLESGCKERPQEILEVLKTEYKDRQVQ